MYLCSGKGSTRVLPFFAAKIRTGPPSPLKGGFATPRKGPNGIVKEPLLLCHSGFSAWPVGPNKNFDGADKANKTEHIAQIDGCGKMPCKGFSKSE